MIKLKDLIKEGGMGILSKDQADILQGLVMKHKNKKVIKAWKTRYFFN